MAKQRNTYAKLQTEAKKKRKAADKRNRRLERKQEEPREDSSSDRSQLANSQHDPHSESQ